MAKILTYCTLVLVTVLSYSTYAQETLEVRGLGTTFIVTGSVGKKLKIDKCPCSIPSKGKCSLFEFNIQKILYYFENKAFSKDELSSVDKILIKKNVKLKRGKKYVISLQPGTSKSYVQFTDTLSINPEGSYKIIHKDGYITDFINCRSIEEKFD